MICDLKFENCKFALVRITLLSLLLSATAALACSYSSSPRPVTNTFLVEVTYKGRPVRGLGIALNTVVDADSDAKPTLVEKGRTDEKGAVKFSNIKNGDYDVEVIQPALPYSIWIRVGKSVNKIRTAKVLDFEWPGEALEVRGITGTVRAPIITGNRLMDLARPQFQFVPNANIVLADLITNETVASTTADSEGRFKLETPAAGMYVLHIDRPGDDRFRALVSDAPLRIDPAAKDLVLDVYLREICGTMVAYNGYPH